MDFQAAVRVKDRGEGNVFSRVMTLYSVWSKAPQWLPRTVSKPSQCSPFGTIQTKTGFPPDQNLGVDSWCEG